MNLQTKQMKEILAKSLLNKIERLEAFEERLNVRFENISIEISGYGNGWFSIFLELYSNTGTKLEQLTKIECVAYDINGQILCVKNTHAFNEKFFGFEVFELVFQVDGIAEKVNKLRLYPKLP